MTRFGDQFRLTLITNDPTLAQRADRAGVDRVGIDLERLGKADRQRGLASRLSEHTTDDLAAVAASLQRAELFVRVNPLNADTPDEVETVLRFGAKVLMLPYFRTVSEVETFVRVVDGRASVMILVETAAALVRIRDILAVPGIDEMMVGLNDLSLDLGADDRFEVLASPLLDLLASEARRAKTPYSFGGVARVDDQCLPIAADLVLAQYPRLGATGAWISRSFLSRESPDQDFGPAITAVRNRLTEWARTSPEELEHAREVLVKRARQLARKRGASQ